jgi:hypothetical protein
MKKQDENTTEVQGTEVEKRYSVTLKTIVELSENKDLLKAFVDTAKENPEMKAPILIQFAKALVKQLKLEV